jgi:hypothetical protein
VHIFLYKSVSLLEIILAYIPVTLYPRRVAEASQIFLRDAHVLPLLLSYEEYWRCDSDVSAINPLVAFYDIHGRKREVLFFYFVPDTTRDRLEIMILIYENIIKKVNNLLEFFTAMWT